MIPFACTHCGMKFQVKDEFAGRQSKCPTCKQSLTVPVPAAMPVSTPDRLDGPASSLQEAGLAGGGVSLKKGRDATASVPSGRSPQEALGSGPGQGQRYVLQGEIARGGMGAVLKAVDCDIRREVAVKYLLDQADGRKKARFVEEAQVTGQLEHPNIVPIHELGVDAQKRLFFTMKLVKGRSLAEVLDDLRNNPKTAEKEWTLGRLLTAFVNICHALSYAHSRGVVHRDLKPANIMLGDFGEVYVMDWGLAKVLGEQAPFWQGDPASGGRQPPDPSRSGLSSGSGERVQSQRAEADLTQDGAILGTPAYMPPEQARGELGAIDERSDVYSLGAILYEILTLAPPIDKKGGMMQILLRVAEGQIVPPEQRAPERARAGQIPRELSAIALKALAKEPANRYADVDRLRRDIELFQEGRSVSAKVDTFRETVVKLVKRNKGASIATGAAAAVLVVVVGYFLQANYRARVAAEEARQKADDNYAAFQQAVQKSVPAFVRSAHLAAEQRNFDDARNQVEAALAADPGQADARLLRAQLLIVAQDFAAASAELEQYLKARPQDARARRLLTLCRDAQPDDLTHLVPIANVLVEQQVPALVDGLLRKYGKDSNEARQVLLKMYRERIEKAWPGWGKNLTIDAAGLHLSLYRFTALTDLSPLRGVPLTSLNCEGTPVTDLAPLAGMPLTGLNCYNTKVTDLAPLTGMPLTWLNCSNCRITDLSPLRGIPLTSLRCHANPIADLSPLQGMPLTKLECGQTSVADLSPLRGMPLTWLNIQGSLLITDLAPLAGMPLQDFFCSSTKVADLSPLQGMPLTQLRCFLSPVADLSPLRGMPLTALDCSDTRVTDLSPLEGMSLVEVRFPVAKVTRGIDVIRRCKSLVHIGWSNGGGTTIAPAEFWKRYDAGEFSK